MSVAYLRRLLFEGCRNHARPGTAIVEGGPVMAYLRQSVLIAGLLAVGVSSRLVFAQTRKLPPVAEDAGQKQPKKIRTGAPSRCNRPPGPNAIRHADKPTCVVFAPDGKTVVTGGDDGAVPCGRSDWRSGEYPAESRATGDRACGSRMAASSSPSTSAIASSTFSTP